MTRKTLFLLVLSACLHFTAGAQSYFNVKATLHSNALLLNGVVERNGKYYTSATCLDSINSLGNGYFISIIGIRFSVWSTSGQLLHDSVFQRADSGRSEISCIAIHELPNHTFLIAANGGDTKGHVKLFLYCFDSTARPLWQKEWDKPADFPMITPFDYWRMADFKPDGHGNYLMLSSIARGPNEQTLLTKLDSSFNEIWHKDFGDNKYSSEARSLIVEDSSYTFGGYYSNINETSRKTFYRTELFRTDTAGNLTWHWQSDTATKRMGLNHLIRTKDGNLAFCGKGAGIQVFAANGFSDFYWRPWIEKIDTTGKTIWSRAIWSYPTNRESSAYSKLVELPNGDIVACGMITSGFDSTEDIPATYGVLVHYAADGTVKWRRKYDYRGDTMYYMLYDMERAQDGGYVMAGQNIDFNGSTATLPWQRAWLLKVDSNGCSSGNDPQCWPVSVPQEPKLAAGSYKVYPNPSTSQLNISYQKESAIPETFFLYDITGRLAAQASLAGAKGNRV